MKHYVNFEIKASPVFGFSGMKTKKTKKKAKQKWKVGLTDMRVSKLKECGIIMIK